MAWAPRYVAPLRHRALALLVGGQTASNGGDGLYAVALPWFVLSHGGGAVMLGTVLAAYGVPRAALIPVGGLLADRATPWRVMMAADLTRAAAITVLAGFTLHTRASLSFLLPITLVLGAGEGVFLPGSQAIVPALVPTDDLQAANALVTSGNQLATILGPAIGGVVVAIVGADVGFGIDAVSFAASVLTLSLIPQAVSAGRPSAQPIASRTSEERPVEPPQTMPAASIRDLLRRSAVLRVVLLILVAGNLGFGGLLEVALPSLIRGALHGGAGGYGIVVASFSVGALLGTMLGGSVKQPPRPALVLCAANGLGMIALGILPYLGAIWAAGVAFATTGALVSFGNLVAITAFQQWAPPRLLGRIMSLLLLASLGVFPISVLLGGGVVHSLGAQAAFPIGAALGLLAILVGLTSRTWREFPAGDDLQAGENTDVATPV